MSGVKADALVCFTHDAGRSIVGIGLGDYAGGLIGLIVEFERQARQSPQKQCFAFVEADGSVQELSYLEVRLRAAALASLLQEKGVNRGDYVSVDMNNCPEFVIAIVAAAYGGFSLIALNHRLTEQEKTERLADLRLIREVRVVTHLTEKKIIKMLEGVELFSQDTRLRKRRFFKKSSQRNTNLATDPSLIAETLIHFSERGAALFDKAASALVLFTSGTSGRPKAVELSWGNLIGAAQASNACLNTYAEGLWQAALPLFHVGGFEIVVRSLLNASPFLLYRKFEAERILKDAAHYGVSHISVVDKMLQAMLAAESVDQLKFYSCILLGGAAMNPLTLAQSLAQGASVYASYGMTETSSQVASKLVDGAYDGSLDILPGYEAQIVTPDEHGVGQLAVRGSGVFKAYLNARAAFTVDGFFLTGDTASIFEGKLKVQERMTDMFVSGGENIYPAEIQDKLLRIPGVSDAYVFGVEDQTWGRRPAAFVERGAFEARPVSKEGNSRLAASDQQEATTGSSSCSNQDYSKEVSKSLERRLSKLYRPRHICVLDEFPRTSIGKIDKETLRQWYDERLEVKAVRLYRVKQKLTKPFITAKTTMWSRESIIVEVEDGAGRTGIGEGVAFSSDWYLPETLDQDLKILEEFLIPLVLNQVYLHPSEVADCFDACAEAAEYPLAKGALEPALWDLYGKVVGKPLWELIGGQKTDEADEVVRSAISSDEKAAVSRNSSSDRETVVAPATTAVPGGLVLGIMSVQKTLDSVADAVLSGCVRVKFKIKPGDDIERIKAVRAAFPDLIIMLDANQTYTERDLDVLKELDTLDITCIEEPLDPKRPPSVGPQDIFSRLVRLQKHLSMLVCLDESMVTYDDALRALRKPELRCYSLKIAKWGGVQRALEFYRLAQERGLQLWMGGMFDTAISKRLHAAFETLSGIIIPGDLASTERYFTTEITKPPFLVEKGEVVLNQLGYETGLGCVLDYTILEKVLVEKRDFAAEGDI